MKAGPGREGQGRYQLAVGKLVVSGGGPSKQTKGHQDEAGIESCASRRCCHITIVSNNNVIVGICYRSSNVTQLKVDINKATRDLYQLRNKNLMLIGDFNYPDIN